MDSKNGTMFTNGTTNVTVNADTKPHPVKWDFTIVGIFFFSFTMILNGVVLALLWRKESRSRPFTVYLICLLTANMVYGIVQNPIDILHSINPVWWMGTGTCTVFMYTNYVLSACVIHSHVLITINRLWAVTYPIHYRTYHSRRVAISICGLMFLYVHICMTPGWLMDAVAYRLPELTNGCAINISYAPLFAWGLGTQWLNYNWPLIFIACSYCYIVFKRRQHQQQRAKVAPSASRASKNESRMHDADGETIHAHPQDRTEKPRSSSSHPFLILTALTFSFLANYTPSQVFYTAIYDIDPKKLTVLFRVGSVLHDLQAALDPIFFAVAMDDVRSAFQRLCGKSIIR